MSAASVLIKRSSRALQWGPPITVVYIGLSSGPGRPGGQPCQKGTNLSIAGITAGVMLCSHARTGGQRKMSGRLFGYARVSVASDAGANNLETQRRLLADCDQVFQDVGSGAPWNRPGLNRLKDAVAPGGCVQVAALDRLGRSLTEVLELLGWLRENQVEVISLRESIDQDSAMGRAMLHLTIVLAEMERDLARESMLAGLERVKATGKHLGWRKGVSRKRAEEIRNMRQRDGLRGRITCSPRHGRIWLATRCLGNNGQRLRLKGYKEVKTIPAHISSCPPGEVLKWQSPWRPA